MAKKSRAELKEDVTAAKEELKVAKSEKRDFEKSHKLAKDTDHSGNEKIGKKWSKFQAMVDKKQKALEAFQAAYSEAKPEKKERVSKYEYPLIEGKEMTTGEKKKHRAKMRADAKRAEKGESKKESKKTEKSSGKKKSKKDKKAKEVPAAENED